MKPKISFFIIILAIIDLLLLSVPMAYGVCEKHTFAEEAPGQSQFFFYSDGRTWDFTAENDMTIMCTQVHVRLAGPGTYSANIKVKINDQEVASWVQDLTTTYIYYTHDSSTNFQLNKGDIITFFISGGTFGTPGGAVADGYNYVQLCDDICQCNPPQITSFSSSDISIDPGKSVTLNWSISDATSASIDQNIGIVDPISGSVTVSPNTTTTYTLVANNSCGSTNESVTVFVGKPLGGTISGRIVDSDGNPISNLHVELRDNKCWEGHVITGGAPTDSNGYYKITGVPAGTFYIHTVSGINGQDYVDKWWDGDEGTIYCEQTTPVVVTAGQDINDINLVMTLFTVDESAVEDFVTRFYKLCLDRPADPDGLKGWVTALMEGSKTGSDVAYGFVFSPEFLKKVMSDEEYLQILYEAFFNRQPDPAGFQGWLDAIKKGATREDVLNGFIYAVEFANLCDEYGILAFKDKTPKTPKEAVEAFVTRFYQLCLDRSPDPAGLDGWTNNLLNQIQTGADVAHGFIDSKEFLEKNTSNEEYLTILYKAFFNRDPDQGGFSTWLSELNSGKDRGYLLDGFLYSKEFAELCQAYGINPY